MIARTAIRLGLAACFAGVSAIAMAQDAGNPEAPSAAAAEAGAGAEGAGAAAEDSGQRDGQRRRADTSAAAEGAGQRDGQSRKADTSAAVQGAGQRERPRQKPDADARKQAERSQKHADQSGKRPRARQAPLEPEPAQASPDPLTPPEPAGPDPKAPGAGDAKSAETAKAPEPEPVDTLARQVLAHAAKAGGKSEASADTAGLSAYYTENRGKRIWVSREGLNAKAAKAIREIHNADEWGLDSSAFQVPANPGARPEAMAEAEIKLSLAVLKYARHARGGRLDPPSLSPIIDRRARVFDPKSVLEGIASAESADAYLRGLHPKSEQFKRLRQAYLSLGRGEGERRLRILANMERWRWMPENLGEFYIWDSVPEQYTRIFDRGKIVLQEKIVVGKPDTPTPIFSASLGFITFNPEWAVPEGIKVNEIAPRLRSSAGGGRNSGGEEGPFFMFGGSGASSGGGGSASDILQQLGGLRVSLNGKQLDPDSVDWSKVDIRRYQFTQGAGGKNVLGVVKFRFPNKHDVYMHDTPDRHLFGDGLRAFSHGCMRTQNPVRFAQVLLVRDRGMSAGQIEQMVASGETTEIQLRNQIPVHVAYFTAEAGEDGRVRFYPDIYGIDSKVASALRGEPVHFNDEPVVSSALEANDPDQEQAASWAHSRHRPRPSAAERRPWNPFHDWN